MTSEWLKVMLEEIARKRDERERALAEQELRASERKDEKRARPRAGTPRP